MNIHHHLICLGFAALISTCGVEPQPAEDTTPKVGNATAKVQEDGSVHFVCSVSDMEAISSFGFELTPPDDGQPIIVEGVRMNSRAFRGKAEPLKVAGIWTWTAFISNGLEKIYGKPDIFVIEPYMLAPDTPGGAESMLLKVDSGDNKKLFKFQS